VEQGHRQRPRAGRRGGRDALRDAATRIFSTGSFWAGGVAMAVALATLTVADRDEGLVAHLQRMGSRLRQ
jgi:glutamate-1-semialdehyde 2,1-aminomutase